MIDFDEDVIKAEIAAIPRRTSWGRPILGRSYAVDNKNARFIDDIFSINEDNPSRPVFNVSVPDYDSIVPVDSQIERKAHALMTGQKDTAGNLRRIFDNNLIDEHLSLVPYVLRPLFTISVGLDPAFHLEKVDLSL